MRLEIWDEAVDGPLSETAMRLKLENWGYSVTRYTYPPGTHFPDHSHVVDKVDGVLSGEFRMCMEGRSVVLKPGDCLFVPAHAVHSAEVVGSESVISLDAVK